MPFYIFAWIGAITSGLITITAKLTSKHAISNPWLFNFFMILVTLGFTIPPAIANHAAFPTLWWPVILAAVFSALFNIFWVFSTYALDVSNMTPLFNFRGVFAVLIGALFLKENLTINQIFLVAVILIAGMFTSMDEKFDVKSFFKKSIFIGIITVLFLALTNTFTKISLQQNPLWTNNLWVNIINLILIIPTIYFFSKDIGKIRTHHILPIVVMGFLSMVSEFSANTAFAVNLGITSLIQNTPFSMIFAFLFSIFAPKLLEKHSLKTYLIRFASTAVMICCAYQLAH